MLDTRECFILDTGSGIFVWVGKGATQKEKTDAMAKAQEFLRTKKYPAWTQIHRIVEGSESAPFKQYFDTWRDAGMSHSRLIRSALGIGSDELLNDDEIDSVVTQLKKSGGRAFGFMPDHGQNVIETITQYVAKPGSDEIVVSTVPFDEKLPLLGFASYVLTYNYEANNGDTGSLTYVWHGVKASAAARKRAFEEGLVGSKDGLLVQTNQGHEPRHFYKIFKGKLLTSFTALPVTAQLSAFAAPSKVMFMLVRWPPTAHLWPQVMPSSFIRESPTKSTFGMAWAHLPSKNKQRLIAFLTTGTTLSSSRWRRVPSQMSSGRN